MSDVVGNSAPVVIVGGGPVGVGLAIDLALRGIRSIWSKNSRTRSPSPKGRI